MMKLPLNSWPGGCLDPSPLTKLKPFFDGHFWTSPLSLVEKVPGSGKWWTIRHLSKEDVNGELMNGWLNADDFLTKYYSASMTADFVHTALTLTL